MLALSLIALGGVAVAACWLINFSPMARARHARHEAAWAGWTVPGADGITRLQYESREWLMRFAIEHDLQLSERREGEAADTWIVTEIPKLGATVWIFPDQIDLATPYRHRRCEYWDADRPSEMLDWLADELAVLVQLRRDSALRGTARTGSPSS